MSEEIEKYVFQKKEVRIVMHNGEPWFVAKDVCDILGTRVDNVRQIVGDKRVMSVNPYLIGVGNHGGRSPLIVNEAGLYKLILSSRKPDAEKFQDWVTDDVLPSIRKHGVYVSTKVALSSPEEQTLSFQKALDSAVQHAIALAEAHFQPQIEQLNREKAWIGDKKVATALQRNSVYARRINTLEDEKEDLETRLDEVNEELACARIDAEKHRLRCLHKSHPNGWSWRQWQMRVDGSAPLFDEYGNPIN